ncbi:hypothetical protein LEP1GSC199_3466 [Leptospira vanthielii serovar Holland str. Waz Holland = ATCC 700522]|uniref:Uncharacterized protein n=1 Tax=Leptospira vanthielii serovar Holland str. Waz Holland = ATCC 700522 TaxID=1218591 RepID=N1WB88_9LEPT|nr:hypothetical protein LEP1GSC199_3466 [Leptospira vanthielii serovar Holland str. Waz Holland = ATCC 700522]
MVPTRLETQTKIDLEPSEPNEETGISEVILTLAVTFPE